MGTKFVEFLPTVNKRVHATVSRELGLRKYMYHVTANAYTLHYRSSTSRRQH